MIRNFIIGVFKGPLRLVLMGVALGYLARLVLGPPDPKQPPREFQQPIVQPADDDSEFTDLPII